MRCRLFGKTIRSDCWNTYDVRALHDSVWGTWARGEIGFVQANAVDKNGDGPLVPTLVIGWNASPVWDMMVKIDTDPEQRSRTMPALETLRRVLPTIRVGRM